LTVAIAKIGGLVAIFKFGMFLSLFHKYLYEKELSKLFPTLKE
jgi:hypothetical protein